MNGRKILAACMVLLACALPATAAPSEKQDAAEEFPMVAEWCVKELVDNLDFKVGLSHEHVALIQKLRQTIIPYGREILHELDGYDDPDLIKAFEMALKVLESTEIGINTSYGSDLFHLANWQRRSYYSKEAYISDYFKRGEALREFAEYVLGVWADLAKNPTRVREDVIRENIRIVLILKQSLNAYDREAESAALKNTLVELIERKIRMKEGKEGTFRYFDNLKTLVDTIKENYEVILKCVDQLTAALDGGKKSKTRLSIAGGLADIVEELHEGVALLLRQTEDDIAVTYNNTKFTSFLEPLTVYDAQVSRPEKLRAIEKAIDDYLRLFRK